RAPRVADVLRELLDADPAPRLARRFPGQSEVAELEPRRARRLVRALAARDAIGNRHPQVAGELLVELLVLTTAPQRQLHVSLSPVRLRTPAIASDSCVHRERAAASWYTRTRWLFSDTFHSARIRPCRSSRCIAGYSEPVSTCSTSDECRRM